MTIATPDQVLAFARRLSLADQRWLIMHFLEQLEAAQSEHTTLNDAVEPCPAIEGGLEQAAELEGVTRLT